MKANQLLRVNRLSENVCEYTVFSPKVSKHARAGQFVIVIVREGGERVPFTICGIDRNAGTINLLVQEVGFTTRLMGTLREGDCLSALVGPLGKPTELEGFSHPILVGGGIGTAVIYPQAEYLASLGKTVDVIVGARNKSLIFYEEEFKRLGVNLFICTDDGSYGEKGFVTQVLDRRLKECGDVVFAVGPMPMMRACVNVSKDNGVKSVVSMNAMMVDGTGMCGCCRVTVGGEVKYACVDGPEFHGELVDFAEAMNRLGVYREFEAHACRLTGESK